MQPKLWRVLLLCGLTACTTVSPTTASPQRSATAAPFASPSADPPPSPHAGVGRTFYVAPHGDNANPGTRDRPWATPGYGSRQLAPGDTLIILGGRYALALYDDDIITPPSGTAQAWIAIRGEEGHRPILVGRDNLATAINLSGAQYVRVENLEITHDDAVWGQAAWFREGGKTT